MRALLLSVAMTSILCLSSPPSAAQPRATVATDAPIVTYPGFRMLPTGGSLVWIEADRAVGVTVTTSERRVVYHLAGAVTLNKNNLRPLITEYFASPVRRVQLVKAKDGLDLVIDLRQPAEGTQHLMSGDRGVSLRVDFPPLAR